VAVCPSDPIGEFGAWTEVLVERSKNMVAAIVVAQIVKRERGLRKRVSVGPATVVRACGEIADEEAISIRSDDIGKHGCRFVVVVREHDQ
jgi:hypothetical protein